MVFVFGNIELLVGEKLSNCREVNITSKYCDAHGLGGSDMLQLPNQPISLIFVMFGSPVVVEVVQNLHAAVEFVDKVAKHTCTTHGFDRIHQPAR
tara:strand:- start:12570 stop:12854 length:285 start_codon:yes stop_codon:yes gene_type:complete